ncbi:hypothetical protein SKAU_G00314620 [Synaphobranchus kaupii]|uniref:Uncharacterized protein n=1 Tax=Synaphobranchus kaupii TaxID=118154 RepID=A0A9Q1ESJ1_SYNKA|nr:hypothetical protein SKAU_G00314620 [Synaphobranchus kaupii]
MSLNSFITLCSRGTEVALKLTPSPCDPPAFTGVPVSHYGQTHSNVPHLPAEWGDCCTTCSGGTNARFASGGNNTAESAPLIKLAFCIPERCADGAAWAREWRAALEYCSGRRELNPHHITAISMRAAFKG